MRKIFQILLVLGLFVLAYLSAFYNKDIIKNWSIFSVLILASVAVFQDPIKRWWNKPSLVFIHHEQRPFRRENTNIIHNDPTLPVNIQGTYERFMIENKGRGPALQCRCQIYSIRQNGNIFGDYRGYPLHWAGRPEANIDPLKGERLNIGSGESEFIDLCYTASIDSNIHLEKYHVIPIGIPDSIPHGVYEVNVICSGDNFRPYFIVFDATKGNSNNINTISVNLVKYWQE